MMTAAIPTGAIEEFSRILLQPILTDATTGSPRQDRDRKMIKKHLPAPPCLGNALMRGNLLDMN